MTDLEITRLCAEAMGYTPSPHPNGRLGQGQLLWIANNMNWNPLRDDAQAMALVKKLNLNIMASDSNGWWEVFQCTGVDACSGKDLNRAICECVAHMQAAKEGK